MPAPPLASALVARATRVGSNSATIDVDSRSNRGRLLSPLRPAPALTSTTTRAVFTSADLGHPGLRGATRASSHLFHSHGLALASSVNPGLALATSVNPGLASASGVTLESVSGLRRITWASSAFPTPGPFIRVFDLKPAILAPQPLNLSTDLLSSALKARTLYDRIFYVGQ